MSIPLLTTLRLHLGHTPQLLHPLMRQKIIGTRAGITIIDLHQTLAEITKAQDICRNIARAGGIVLFVGGKVREDSNSNKKVEKGGGREMLEERSRLGREIERIAKESWCYAITRSSWIPGTLTNMKQVLPVKKRDMTSYMVASDSNASTRRDDQVDRNLVVESAIEKSLLPDLILVFDANRQKKLLTEAKLMNVPTIGICDSDMDPTTLTWAIPANDDSPEGVLVIAEMLGSAIREGTVARMKAEEEDEITMTSMDLDNADTLMKGNGLYAV